MLGKGNRAAMLDWLTESLPSIIAAARYKLAKDGQDSPSRKALRAAVIDRMLAFWKTHQKNPGGQSATPAQARLERGKAAAARVVEELQE
jgi:hypothetical protein